MQTFISREQDYALRITALLSVLKTGEQLSIKEISNKLYISKNFAARIVHKLRHAGIVETVQGNKGGVFLFKDAEKLSVYEVLNCIGFSVKMNKCLCGDFECMLEEKCGFHSFFSSHEAKLLASFRNTYVSQFALTDI